MDKQADRGKDGKTYNETDAETERQKSRQTNRNQRDREDCRQTNSQRERQTYTQNGKQTDGRKTLCRQKVRKTTAKSKSKQWNKKVLNACGFCS